MATEDLRGALDLTFCLCRFFADALCEVAGEQHGHIPPATLVFLVQISIQLLQITGYDRCPDSTDYGYCLQMIRDLNGGLLALVQSKIESADSGSRAPQSAESHTYVPSEQSNDDMERVMDDFYQHDDDVRRRLRERINEWNNAVGKDFWETIRLRDATLLGSLGQTLERFDRANTKGCSAKINNHLYDALRRAMCQCIQENDPRHHVRLMLRTDDFQQECRVSFSTLVSGHLNGSRCINHWQHVRFILPSDVRETTYATAVETRITTMNDTSVDAVTSLCTLTSDWQHGIHRPASVRHDGSFFELYDENDPDAFCFENVEGVSLSSLLRSSNLTTRQRLGIAYALAVSVWRYYDSNWMEQRWNIESIRFMIATSTRSTAGIQIVEPRVPSFAVNFADDLERLKIPEYAKNQSHEYPRKQCLGLLLLEIGRDHADRPLRTPEAQTTLSAHINANKVFATMVLNQDPQWPYLDTDKAIKDQYRKLTEYCLGIESRRRTYRPPIKSTDAEQRRDQLWQNVVKPLASLLTRVCWQNGSNDIHSADPLEIVSLDLEIRSDSMWDSKSLDCLPKNKRKAQLNACNKSPKEWLANAREILWKFLRPRSDVCGDRVRIAVLDTGFDPTAPFFNPLRRKRLLGHWKDFLDHQELPIDEVGHGTEIVALTMMMAPLADIYVARVAKDSDSLPDSRDLIAEAIAWATDKWAVDIICMSFGMEREEGRPGRDCLRLAINNSAPRNAQDSRFQPLFFAAAGNEGANGPCMYPAQYETVIPVYGTDASGGFIQKLNPTRGSNRTERFGSLAEGIPHVNPEKGDNESLLGTSYSTAIVAGLAGSLLQYSRIIERLLPCNSSLRSCLSEQMRTREGMTTLLRGIALTSEHEQYYLSPADFFERPEPEMHAKVVDAHFDSLSRKGS